MVKMTPQDWRRVGEAIVVWSGWGRNPWPSRSDESVSKYFGSDAAAKLLPIIRELVNDFYGSNARHTAADLAEMARVSSQQFMTKHPDAPEDAVRALAWCYTFDYK